MQSAHSLFCGSAHYRNSLICLHGEALHMRLPPTKSKISFISYPLDMQPRHQFGLKLVNNSFCRSFNIYKKLGGEALTKGLHKWEFLQYQIAHSPINRSYLSALLSKKIIIRSASLQNCLL